MAGRLTSLLFLGFLFQALVGLGATEDCIQHFEEEVSTPTHLITGFSKATTERDPLSLVEINEIINIGQKIWKIIEANKPVLNVKFDYANALPKGIESSDELEGFSNIQMKSRRLYGKNLYGATVYDLTYTAVHRFGGSYEGHGQYLENVTILPQNIDVLWGYTVNLAVNRVSTVNVGTKSKPIASILMELDMDVSTVMKTSQVKKLIQFRGDSPEVITSERCDSCPSR